MHGSLCTSCVIIATNSIDGIIKNLYVERFTEFNKERSNEVNGKAFPLFRTSRENVYSTPFLCTQIILFQLD